MSTHRQVNSTHAACLGRLSGRLKHLAVRMLLLYRSATRLARDLPSAMRGGIRKIILPRRTEDGEAQGLWDGECWERSVRWRKIPALR